MLHKQAIKRITHRLAGLGRPSRQNNQRRLPPEAGDQDDPPHRQQRQQRRRQAQSEIVAKKILLFGIRRLNIAQAQRRKHKDRRRHRQPQGELAHILRRAQFGQHNSHGEPGTGINHITHKRP